MVSTVKRKAYSFTRKSWRICSGECCDEKGQRSSSIDGKLSWKYERSCVQHFFCVLDIRSSNVAKTRERCSRRRLSDLEGEVNPDWDSVDGSGEEAKLSENTVVVHWSKQTSQTRGWSSLWVSGMRVPQEYFGCRIEILNDSESVSGHILVGKIFAWLAPMLCSHYGSPHMLWDNVRRSPQCQSSARKWWSWRGSCHIDLFWRKSPFSQASTDDLCSNNSSHRMIWCSQQPHDSLIYI